MVEDAPDTAAVGTLRTIGELLGRYGRRERALFVDSMIDDSTGTVDWDTVAGLEFWGGSGAVWEVEPFIYSHPGDERSEADTLDFYAALLTLAEQLQAKGMSHLADSRVEMLRRMVASR